MKNTTPVWLGFVILLAVLTFYRCNPSPASPPATPTPKILHSDVGAWVACQQFVEQRLKSPATADFPANYPQYTKLITDTTYRVDAYVDSQNSFEAMIRTEFTCEVKQTGDEENYTLVSLDFVTR